MSPVEIVPGDRDDLYAGRSLRAALDQLDADLGSATMAIEEALQAKSITRAERTSLAHVRISVVSAARRVAEMREKRGWGDDQ